VKPLGRKRLSAEPGGGLAGERVQVGELEGRRRPVAVSYPPGALGRLESRGGAATDRSLVAVRQCSNQKNNTDHHQHDGTDQLSADVHEGTHGHQQEHAVQIQSHVLGLGQLDACR